MSVPTTLFIDTSIFDEAAYNFEAASVVAFKEAVKGIDLTLLLPDPTIREINRHISERAASAVKSLEDAARRAPFLHKLSSWPLNESNPQRLTYQIDSIASDDLSSFLKLFKVIKLDYSGVDVQEIMNWYDWRRAPFSEKKKSEFPDALAVASINQYHNKHSEPIAVVSRDKDFRAVCELYTHLLYFPSLSAFSEALKKEDVRIEAIQCALEKNDDQIRKTIAEVFADSGFYIEADWDGDVSDPELTDFESLEYHVVAIGEEACSVAFDGEAIYSAYVSYDDYETAVYDGGEAFPIHRIEGTAEDSASVSGVVKLRTTDNGATIVSVESVALDQSDFTISNRPEEYF